MSEQRLSRHGRNHLPGGSDPIPGLEALGAGFLLNRNVGELGFTGSGTQATTYTHTIQFENVEAGDGILIAAMAPSLPVIAGSIGHATSCADTAGNTYSSILTRAFEAASPAVNEGAFVNLFYCQSSVAQMVAGVDTITVTWSNSVFDRSIYAWLVRHDGGANIPQFVAATASNDATTYASSQVVLTSAAWTTRRENALAFAMIIAIKAGGVGSFGGVGGYSGYFQAQSRAFSGSKQSYLFNVQTFSANVFLIVGGGQYELDIGTLPALVPVASFNGVGQNYSSGTNAWKGIILHGID